jgi:hypothetical protein
LRLDMTGTARKLAYQMMVPQRRDHAADLWDCREFGGQTAMAKPEACRPRSPPSIKPAPFPVSSGETRARSYPAQHNTPKLSTVPLDLVPPGLTTPRGRRNQAPIPQQISPGSFGHPMTGRCSSSIRIRVPRNPQAWHALEHGTTGRQFIPEGVAISNRRPEPSPGDLLSDPNLYALLVRNSLKAGEAE